MYADFGELQEYTLGHGHSVLW